MTDREKLIKLLRGDMCKDVCCYECEYENNDKGCTEHIKQNTVDHLIANGVTFAKDTNVPSWIPVTERLPEDDLPKDSKRKSIKVLVTYKTSSGVPVVRTQVREKEPWFNSKGWDWPKSEPITHWMPLPEPPKEDNHD